MLKQITITIPQSMERELDTLAANIGLPRDIIAAKVLGMTLPSLNNAGVHSIEQLKDKHSSRFLSS